MLEEPGLQQRRMTEDKQRRRRKIRYVTRLPAGQGQSYHSCHRSRGKVTEVACNDDVSSGQGEMLSHTAPCCGLFFFLGC